MAAWLALILYLVTVAVLGVRLRQGDHAIGVLALTLWLAALAAHVVTLSNAILSPEGLNLAFFQAGSTTALLIAAVLLFNCLRKPLLPMALLILPITAVLCLLGHLDENRVIVAATPGIRVHVLSSLLAYSVLGLTGAQAIMLHFQNHALRGQSYQFLPQALPPLEAMESFLFHLLTLGLVLLSVSLVSGWIYHHDLFAQHLVHKTVLSAAAWLMFAALLMGHTLIGWRGEIAVKLTLVGLALLVTAYFGSKFVLEYILQRV